VSVHLGALSLTEGMPYADEPGGESNAQALQRERATPAPVSSWRKLLGPVIASAAVTTGLFVLAGVLVGGLVTGGVNYALERRRERSSARIAIRLLEVELAIAAVSADWAIEDGLWSHGISRAPTGLERVPSRGSTRSLN
jgi:hypothetical protein